MAVDLSDPWLILGYILLGAILGMVGQTPRMIMGLKKAAKDAAAEGEEEWFVANKFLTSFIIAFMIGAIAGIIGIVTILEKGGDFSELDYVTIIGFGYAGTDLIEGFMKEHFPS